MRARDQTIKSLSWEDTSDEAPIQLRTVITGPAKQAIRSQAMMMPAKEFAHQQGLHSVSGSSPYCALEVKCEWTLGAPW